LATNLTDSEDTYSSFGLGNLAINRFELVSETMAFGLAPPPLKTSRVQKYLEYPGLFVYVPLFDLKHSTISQAL
jgi:hypothetical protein